MTQPDAPKHSAPNPYLSQAEMEWIEKSQGGDDEWRKKFLGDWSFVETCPRCRMTNEECKCERNF